VHFWNHFIENLSKLATISSCFLYACRTASATYTPYSMTREIDYINDFLFAVDGKMRRPFAYPCDETLAGGKDYVDTLRKYGLSSNARAGGDTSADHRF
jgi:hypothetical protein